MGYYLGLDIGASTVRCLIVSAELSPVVKRANTIPDRPTKSEFLATITRIIEDTLTEFDGSRDHIHSAGIGSFGPLDTQKGLILETPNLDVDLQDIPVTETVAQILAPETPIILVNDAIAGVTAEYHAGGTEENLAYVTISSGIGAGVVVDGHILQGRQGNVAEIGHITLDPASDRKCGCGGTGHWEAFASGENIPQYARELAANEGIESDLLATEDSLTAEMIFGAYGDDPLATELLTRVGRWNTLGMATLVQAFAPSRVAVGGSVALNNESLILEPIREQLDAYVMNPVPEVHLTEFGDDVVLRGAVVQASRVAEVGR